jgi:hypothetical protein
VRLFYGNLDLTNYPYGIQFGLDGGAPQNQTEALALLLQDGEVVLSDRASNLTMQFNVMVEGADLLECAENFAALIAESDKPLNTITLDPEDYGPPSVYDSFRAQVTHARNDDGELARQRIYTVVVSAAPFVRSVAEVVIPALPASGTTTTLVNDGSVTTGWTGTVDGVSATPAVVSGAVRVTTTSVGFTTCVLGLTLTASIATSSTKYIVVDWKPESLTGGPDLRVYGDGVELPQLAQSASPTAGMTRTWFGPVAASSIAALTLKSSSSGGAPLGGSGATRSLNVDNINRTDIAPSSGTGRQLLRSIEIAGSARTQGSVTIEHASSALGDVLAYFFPDSEDAQGYSPQLRQYRISGGTVTTDATLVSGARESISPSGGGGAAAVVFDIPVSRLAAGLHTLMARAKVNTGVSGTATFAWITQLRINGTDVGPSRAGSSTVSAVGTATAQTIYTLGRLMLPTRDVDLGSTTAVVRLTLWLVDTVFSGMEFDEAWLFNSSIGRLVQVACGTGSPASGGPANRLFIEPATVLTPRPTVRIGFAADRSDSFHPATLSAWQFPEFAPPRVNMLLVTTNAADASVSFRSFPRWHTHAAL